jgi:hypothetical protein
MDYWQISSDDVRLGQRTNKYSFFIQYGDESFGRRLEDLFKHKCLGYI